MLCLKNITKNYYSGEEVVRALKGVSLNFRKSEFVSILGQSGCGKTTLLNIIGGLDKYTEGDLIINGTSTKNYTDRDWDKYRNISIGFVFQSYNLIPHQTVLENVELALTLSGVGAEERRARAIEALKKVGLSDQIKKRPNQLSGGQMQRVAIARAIVNNPDIILADEPTGALDSETSLQIMDILREISKTKLIVMVTHNPEIAKEYSSRIINLKDGLVISDSNPYLDEEVANDQNALEVQSPEVSSEPIKIKKKKIKRHSMSFWTAVKLSVKNLFTKKTRTILTSFAGSIGIIGIALILSLSSGFNTYINRAQEDALSNYPITIEKTSVDMGSIMTDILNEQEKGESFPDSETVTSNDLLSKMFSSVFDSVVENDLKDFKKYLDSELEKDENREIISALKYIYNLDVSWYKDGVEVNDFDMQNIVPAGAMLTQNAFSEMIDNDELIKNQYDILWGDLPSGENKANQVVIVVDEHNAINDSNMYNIGFNSERLEYFVMKTYLTAYGISEEKATELLSQEGYTADMQNTAYTFDDFKNVKFKVVTNADYYKKGDNGLYENVSSYKKVKMGDNTLSLDRLSRKANKLAGKVNPMFSVLSQPNPKLTSHEVEMLKTATEVEVVGILRLKEGVSSGALTGTINYTSALTKQLIVNTMLTDVYKEQSLSNKSVITGEEFGTEEDKQKTLDTLGIIDVENPQRIAIYPSSFSNKDKLEEIINNYNEGKDNDKKIKYTDYLGIMMSSITTIINAISYVLIAFVSISLVVSSIMIGIITYISVLERTKEIGVLRSLGASKKDISRVFNAETLIVGFTSGMMGVLLTVLLNLLVTAIIQKIAKITAVALLPLLGAIILVVISTVLTLISGIIPSRIAAKKDPVIALRTE